MENIIRFPLELREAYDCGEPAPSGELLAFPMLDCWLARLCERIEDCEE